MSSKIIIAFLAGYSIVVTAISNSWRDKAVEEAMDKAELLRKTVKILEVTDQSLVSDEIITDIRFRVMAHNTIFEEREKK